MNEESWKLEKEVEIGEHKRKTIQTTKRSWRSSEKERKEKKTEDEDEDNEEEGFLDGLIGVNTDGMAETPFSLVSTGHQ